MLKKTSLIVFFSICFTTLALAQTGKVSGTLIDGDTNDVLPFANVAVKGTDKGATTDFDGDYSINLDEGTYTLTFSFVGYETKQVNEVVVKSGKTTDLSITLNPSAGMLDEVMITTTARRNTEESVLNLQKNSAILMDGLSIQSIKSSGASTIASAVKNVPGVSIQDGKYVYVRGLGDRYTKSILNGMDIPGLDPDKNTIQLDIFPTNILENILVVKSASADLPADFTGGVVNIITKDFPSQKHIGISFSTSYNPDMHFKDNYLTYDGGNTDFLGFDDGTRKLPVPKKTDTPTPTSNNPSLEAEQITRKFNPTLAAKTATSNPDFSLGFNYGNQYTVGNDNKLGFIASLDYKNTTTFYEGFENGIYQKPPSDSETPELRADRKKKGNLGKNNVLASALAGLSYKTDKSKYKLNLLHIQNGESEAALFNQSTDISNNIDVVKNGLSYTQRSMSNLLLSGKHTSEDASFTTEWKVSPTLSKAEDKDVRITTFIDKGDGVYSISSDSGFPQRLWRDLEEVDLVGKVDFAKKYDLFNNNSTVKFGGLYSNKHRKYSISNFITYKNGDINTEDLNGDPNAILSEEYIYTAETNKGYYIKGNYQPANTFDATQNTGAIYVSNEFKIGKKFRSILGVRMEKFDSYLTGQNYNQTEIYDNKKTIDKLDFFPSTNFIYELQDGMNLRLSYARTTARPSFKELSPVQIYDIITDLTFLGNPNVNPSYIHNIDLRYEFYGNNAQMFAVSGFYKNFKDPIEIVAYNNLDPKQITPRNTASADVYGVEFEGRKNFGFISEGLKNLSLKVNVSLIESKIEMGKGPGQEYESRVEFARTEEGEKVEDTRPLQGQSPFLINTSLNYKNNDIGLESGLFYNVQGKTLEVVGLAQNPDVYTQPFHSLSFNISKKIGKERRSKLSFKVNNILDDDRESLYESFHASKQVFRLRSPGRSFSIGYSLDL